MVNPPRGSEYAATKSHTGKPGAVPRTSVGFPALSKTCQAMDPPCFQPVPSVHARRTSPRESPATAGCLRSCGSPGAAILVDNLRPPPPAVAKYTCSSVCQASKLFSPAGLIEAVDIGHAFSSQGETILSLNVLP